MSWASAAGRMGVRRERAGRLAWGIVDQGLSSVTNFGITLVVARLVPLAELGAFGLVFSLYVCSLLVCRSLCLEPFTVRFSPAPAADQAAAARGVIAGAAVVAVLAGMTVCAAGAVGGRPTFWVAATMAAALPALLVQDAYRYVLFASNRSRSAAANDLVWCVVQFAAVAALVLAGRASTTTLTAAFGLGAGAAAAVGYRQTGVGAVWRSAWPWLRSQRHLGLLFAAEMVLVVGAIQLGLVAVAVVAGMEEIGALRAAMLLFGPLTVLFVGIGTVALPVAARRRERTPSSLAGFVAGLGLVMPVVALAWGAVLLAVPQAVGSSFLGSAWAPARRLVVPMSLLTGANAGVLAASIGLRALGAGRHSLRAQLWAAPLIPIGGLVGAAWWGAHGAAVGMAAGTWVDAAVVGAAFWRHRTGGLDLAPVSTTLDRTAPPSAVSGPSSG